MITQPWSIGPSTITRGARGAGRVRYREFVDGVWGATWRSVGGNYAHTPTLVAWGGNRLSLFAVDASGRLWMRLRRGRTWSPAQSAWIDLGTPASGLASRVQVGITGHDQATGTDTFSVFGICADGRLALKWWTGTGFGPSTTGWWDLGGSLCGEPAVAAYRGSRISIGETRSSGDSTGTERRGRRGTGWELRSSDHRRRSLGSRAPGDDQNFPAST
jgi:hypothetical protein